MEIIPREINSRYQIRIKWLYPCGRVYSNARDFSKRDAVWFEIHITRYLVLVMLFPSFLFLALSHLSLLLVDGKRGLKSLKRCSFHECELIFEIFSKERVDRLLWIDTLKINGSFMMKGKENMISRLGSPTEFWSLIRSWNHGSLFNALMTIFSINRWCMGRKGEGGKWSLNR